MKARKDSTVRPARRQVTFAWPVAAAAAVFVLVGLRWPRAPYTPARARVSEAPPSMAFVEIPHGARGFLWPRDFAQGHLDAWPRVMEMDAPPQSTPPPPPFREWPADDDDGDLPAEVPAE